MHIEQWIILSDVVTLPVHHAHLNINNTCVILLASFDDPECPEYLSPPFQPTTSIASDDIMTSYSISEFTAIAQPTMGESHKGETFPPVVTKLTESDTGTIVGGAVAIVLMNHNNWNCNDGIDVSSLFSFQIEAHPTCEAKVAST